MQVLLNRHRKSAIQLTSNPKYFSLISPFNPFLIELTKGMTNVFGFVKNLMNIPKIAT